MIYYISDTHFYHENIIKLSNRPFSTLEDMHNKLIENWNNVVTNEDTIYFLGDFSFKTNQNTATQILKQLNGIKYFIKGNHDKPQWLNQMKEQGLIKDWSNLLEIKDNGRDVVLCHYPLHSWNKMYRGSYHLYGHVHQNTVNNEEFQKNRFNVCCEELGYTPKTLDQLIEERRIMKSIEESIKNCEDKI